MVGKARNFGVGKRRAVNSKFRAGSDANRVGIAKTSNPCAWVIKACSAQTNEGRIVSANRQQLNQPNEMRNNDITVILKEGLSS